MYEIVVHELHETHETNDTTNNKYRTTEPPFDGLRAPSKAEGQNHEGNEQQAPAKRPEITVLPQGASVLLTSIFGVPC